MRQRLIHTAVATARRTAASASRGWQAAIRTQSALTITQQPVSRPIAAVAPFSSVTATHSSSSILTLTIQPSLTQQQQQMQQQTTSSALGSGKDDEGLIRSSKASSKLNSSMSHALPSLLSSDEDDDGR